MTNLSRRTVLGAVPLLAAVPAIASTKPDHGKLSPAIAALVEKRVQLKAESERLDDEGGWLDDAIEARGGGDDSEVFRLEERSTELMRKYWSAMYDILEIPAASVADLAVQFETLIEDSADISMDQTVVTFDLDIRGLEFLKRLPSEIVRLAGVS